MADNKMLPSGLPPLEFDDEPQAVTTKSGLPPLSFDDEDDEIGQLPVDSRDPESSSTNAQIERQAELEKQYSIPESMARGAVKNAPLLGQFIDELGGGLEVAGAAVGLRGVGSDSVSNIRLETDEEDKQSFGDIYREARDGKRQRYDEAYEANPFAYGTGATASTLSGAMLPKAVNVSKADKLPAVLGKGATVGGVTAAGASTGETWKDVTLDTVLGAGGGAVGAAGAKYVLEPAIKGAVKNVIARPLGRADVVDDYMANASKVNDPDIGFEPIQSKMDDYATGVYASSKEALESADDTIANSRLIRDQGEAALKESDGVVKAGYDAHTMARKGYDADVKAAERALAEASRGSEAEVRAAEKVYQSALRDAKSRFAAEQKAVQVPDEAVEAVDGALKRLEEQMKAAAAQQRSTLPDDMKVPVKDMHSWIDAQLKERVVNGAFDPMDDDAKFLQLMKSRLERKVRVEGQKKPVTTVPDMTPDELLSHRQMTKGGGFDANTGARLPKSDRFVREYRAKLNEKLDSLGTGEQHKAARAILAKKISALDEASDRFGGDSDQVRRMLGRVGDPKHQEVTAALERLEKEAGGDIKAKLSAYLDAKRLGANEDELRAAFMKTNPAAAEREAVAAARSAGQSRLSQSETELGSLRQSAKARADLLENEADEVWAAELDRQAGIRQGMTEAEQKAAEAVAQKAAAKAALKQTAAVSPIGANGTPDSQATLRKLLFASDKKPETQLKAAVSNISEELPEQIRLLRIKQKLAGGGPQGSRGAVVGGNLAQGFVAAAGGGPIAQKVARGIGNLGGAAVDYSAGTVTKIALDLTRQVPKAFHGIIQAVALGATSDPAMAQYMKALEAAQARGPEAVAATAAIIAKDPEFQKRAGGVK